LRSKGRCGEEQQHSSSSNGEIEDRRETQGEKREKETELRMRTEEEIIKYEGQVGINRRREKREAELG
jgi:hypothetical protein